MIEAKVRLPLVFAVHMVITSTHGVLEAGLPVSFNELLAKVWALPGPVGGGASTLPAILSILETLTAVHP